MRRRRCAVSLRAGPGAAEAGQERFEAGGLRTAGESGSGKTTAARLAIGMYRPDGGTNTYRDRADDVHHISTAREPARGASRALSQGVAQPAATEPPPARNAHLRRNRIRPRRVDPQSYPRPAATPAPRTRPDPAVHLPRLGRGHLLLRPRRRDAARMAGGRSPLGQLATNPRHGYIQRRYATVSNCLDTPWIPRGNCII